MSDSYGKRERGDEVRSIVRTSESESAKPELTPIGGRLSEVRVAYSDSQANFAARLGVPHKTYTRWERGIREVSVAGMKRLVELGWNANWIFTGEGPRRFDDLDEPRQDMLRVALHLQGWEEADQRVVGRIKDFATEYGTERDPSQPVSLESLTLALQQIEEVATQHRLPMPPARKAELSMAVAELIEDGMSEAKVLRFVRAALAA